MACLLIHEMLILFIFTMHFLLKNLRLRNEWTLPSFRLMFPAPIASQSSIFNISPIDASMTLGGMPPLNNVKINAVDLSNVVAAGAGSNEILTAFASLDKEREDATKSDGTLPVEFQCRYRRGKCSRPRTLKKNGSMHSYCEYHRQLSIRNQRAFDQKKRRQRQELEAAEEAVKRLCCSRQLTSDSCVGDVEI